MTTPLLDRLAALEAKATKGPWSWIVSLDSKQVRLEGSPGRGRETVMDFVRYGMGNAAPRFIVKGLMEHAKDLTVTVPGREHHEKWFRDIDHPDARLIAEMRSALPLLLAVAKAAERSADWPSKQDCDYSVIQKELESAVRALREAT